MVKAFDSIAVPAGEVRVWRISGELVASRKSVGNAIVQVLLGGKGDELRIVSAERSGTRLTWANWSPLWNKPLRTFPAGGDMQRDPLACALGVGDTVLWADLLTPGKPQRPIIFSRGFGDTKSSELPLGAGRARFGTKGRIKGPLTPRFDSCACLLTSNPDALVTSQKDVLVVDRHDGRIIRKATVEFHPRTVAFLKTAACLR